MFLPLAYVCVKLCEACDICAQDPGLSLSGMPQSRKKLEGLLECEQLCPNNPSVLHFGRQDEALKCTTILTRHSGKLLVELIPSDDSEEGLWMSHGRVRSSINKLQLSISYRNLLDIAVHEVRVHLCARARVLW
jgi:hypothetical protein